MEPARRRPTCLRVRLRDTPRREARGPPRIRQDPQTTLGRGHLPCLSNHSDGHVSAGPTLPVRGDARLRRLQMPKRGGVTIPLIVGFDPSSRCRQVPQNERPTGRTPGSERRLDGVEVALAGEGRPPMPTERPAATRRNRIRRLLRRAYRQAVAGARGSAEADATDERPLFRGGARWRVASASVISWIPRSRGTPSRSPCRAFRALPWDLARVRPVCPYRQTVMFVTQDSGVSVSPSWH
jgi:hypothetical protein